jgi:Leucine-rich repeat (LRR) protein
LQDLSFLSDLSSEKLTSLNLSNNNFPEQDLSVFSRFVNLKTLNLSKNNLTSIDLSQNKNLKQLDLSYNSLTFLNLSECKELRELNLGKNQLTSVEFLNTLPNPEKLEELILVRNNIQPTTLEFLRSFVNLKVLKI